MTTNATARRTYYVHHAVHVVQAGAENALCGVRLLGAIDTTADATCDRCKAHRFETTPGLWAKVQPIGDGELHVTGGLPESTAGFPTDRHDDDVETVRLTIRARELRRGDRVLNLVAGRTVTVFDLELDVDVVELWPTQADLEAGAAWRYEAAVGELVVVDRQVHAAGFAPVQPAAAPVVDAVAPTRLDAAAITRLCRSRGIYVVSHRRSSGAVRVVPVTDDNVAAARQVRDLLIAAGYAAALTQLGHEPGDAVTVTLPVPTPPIADEAPTGELRHEAHCARNGGEWVDPCTCTPRYVAAAELCAQCGDPEASLRHRYPLGHVFVFAA